MASIVSANKSFQKHFENGIYFHMVLPTEAKQSIFTNCYPIAVSPGLGFSSSLDGPKWAIPMGGIRYSLGQFTKR